MPLSSKDTTPSHTRNRPAKKNGAQLTRLLARTPRATSLGARELETTQRLIGPWLAGSATVPPASRAATKTHTGGATRTLLAI